MVEFVAIFLTVEEFFHIHARMKIQQENSKTDCEYCKLIYETFEDIYNAVKMERGYGN